MSVVEIYLDKIPLVGSCYQEIFIKYLKSLPKMRKIPKDEFEEQGWLLTDIELKGEDKTWKLHVYKTKIKVNWRKSIEHFQFQFYTDDIVITMHYIPNRGGIQVKIIRKIDTNHRVMISPVHKHFGEIHNLFNILNSKVKK